MLQVAHLPVKPVAFFTYSRLMSLLLSRISNARLLHFCDAPVCGDAIL